MPQAPLIGKVAMPDFNILGALIGGPRYMSQYLGARDQAQQAQTQMGMNADWARQLEATPQFQAGTQARDRPAWDLWATMQGGNPQQSALGTSLLESGIAQGYGRDMADYQAALQKKQTEYANSLSFGTWKEELKLSGAQQEHMADYNADTQLKMAQKQAQMVLDQKQAMMDSLNDPQTGQNQAMKNYL